MFLLVLFLVADCSNNNNEAFENAMAKGKEALISEEYEKALASFELALDEKSDDEEAKVLVAQTERMIEALELQDDGEFEEALAIFEEVENTEDGYARLSEQAKEQREALVALIEEQESTEEATVEVEAGIVTESAGELEETSTVKTFEDAVGTWIIDPDYVSIYDFPSNQMVIKDTGEVINQYGGFDITMNFIADNIVEVTDHVEEQTYTMRR